MCSTMQTILNPPIFPVAFGVFAVLAVITFRFQKLHPIVVILLGAAAGILFSM